MERCEVAKRWRVMAHLPRAPAAKEEQCRIIQSGNRIFAEAKELVDHFSFTVSQVFVDKVACKASMIYNRQGRLLERNRWFKRNDVVFLQNVSGFVQITATCEVSDIGEYFVEWEIDNVRFVARNRGRNWIELYEDLVYIKMPIDPQKIQKFDDIFHAVQDRIIQISDERARNYISSFLLGMVDTYILAIGEEFKEVAPSEQQLQSQTALPEPQPQPAEEFLPPIEIEEAEETEDYLGATGTDDVQFAFDRNIAAMQAAAMREETMSRHQRNRSRGK